MRDGRNPDGTEDGRDLAEAFRAADAEARPRPEFRDRLRARFVAGDLAPAPAPPRVRSLPRWILYPAAAALLAATVYASGVLEPPVVADPVTPLPAPVLALEEALRAAEGRVHGIPSLASVRWQRRIVDGRGWLVAVPAPTTDGKELKVLASHAAEAEAALARNLDGIAARPSPPLVLVVAPTRESFEALVAPTLAPMEVGAMTAASVLREAGVLLLSPETLSPGGTPCEDMEGMAVVHEAAHAWLHLRAAPGVVLPLWADEGIAGAAAASGYDPKQWCAQVLAAVRKANLDAVHPEEVLSFREFGAMVRLVATRAPRKEQPYALVSVFFAQAEGLVLFLTDDGSPARKAAFLRWLGERLDGKPTDPAATAKDLGFASVEALFAARDALFAARDAWLGL